MSNYQILNMNLVPYTYCLSDQELNTNCQEGKDMKGLSDLKKCVTIIIKIKLTNIWALMVHRDWQTRNHKSKESQKAYPTAEHGGLLRCG